MKNPNLFQLLFLLRNDKDDFLSRIFDKDEFIFSFIEHLTQHFEKIDMSFTILEPLLDPEIESEQQTVLSIDNVEVGELYLICNSFSDESSLVYYSPSGLIESYILDYDDFEEFKISDYVLLLNEFGNYLLGEKMLYQKINEPW